MGRRFNQIRVGLLGGLVTTVAFGQTAAPTYSIEAVAVNDIPVPGGSTSRVAVTHGDVITAQIFIRDWSPGGEKLRAYQIKIDDSSYASGEQGVVQPVGFQMNPDRDPNAFIDESDPKWVHRGQPTIPLTDSASQGYRWLSVLLDPYGGPASAQDGKKFSCGTVKLTPSLNAKGTFTIALVEDEYVTGLITPENEQILGIQYERLIVEIETTVRWGRILSSDPPDGSVEARSTMTAGATGGPWTTVRLVFNSDCSKTTADDFMVEDGTGKPPRIRKTDCNGATLTLTLDRPIGSGVWTTITHKSSSTYTRLGRFPGDVDSDGKADTRDVLMLLDAINGNLKLLDHQADIDGNGSLGTGDVLQLLDVITDSRVRARPKTTMRNGGWSARSTP